MVKLLKHYLPDRQLDLNTLRHLSSQLDEQSSSSRQLKSPVDSVPPQPPEASATPAQEYDSTLAAGKFTNQLDLEELADLNEQLGCLLRDSRGQYREWLTCPNDCSTLFLTYLAIRIHIREFRHRIQRSRPRAGRRHTPKPSRPRHHPSTTNHESPPSPNLQPINT